MMQKVVIVVDIGHIVTSVTMLATCAFAAHFYCCDDWLVEEKRSARDAVAWAVMFAIAVCFGSDRLATDGWFAMLFYLNLAFVAPWTILLIWFALSFCFIYRRSSKKASR